MGTRTTSTPIETCPTCGGFDLRVTDSAWFTLDLDRAEHLREPAPEFRCRDCGTAWT